MSISEIPVKLVCCTVVSQSVRKSMNQSK